MEQTQLDPERVYVKGPKAKPILVFFEEVMRVCIEVKAPDWEPAEDTN